MCDHFIQEDVVDVSSRTFEEPYVELFLWSVICNKPGLIQFFWRRCAQPILMAVIAALIYAKLLQYYADEARHSTVGTIKDRKNEFLTKANELGRIDQTDFILFIRY